MAHKVESEATKGHEPWTRTSRVYNSVVAHPTKEGSIALMKLANDRHPFDAPGGRVIDLGAGTGAFAVTLAQKYPNLEILATDISEAMLSQLRDAQKAQLAEQGKTDKDNHVSVRELDLHDPCGPGGEPEGSYTHAICTYALEIILDPQSAINGMYKLLRSNSGSIAAVAWWDFSRVPYDPHEIWEESATAADSKYRAPPRNISNPWHSREEVEEGMRKAGFQDVEGEAFVCKFVMDEEQFMEWFWKSQNPMTVERKRSWTGDLEPVREAMQKIVEQRKSSGRGIWVTSGLILGTKP